MALFGKSKKTQSDTQASGHDAPNTYDFVFMGTGHTGLVAAAYLAKAGKRVLLLESRDYVGGESSPAS